MYEEQTIEQNIQGHGRNLMGVALVAMLLVGAYQLWLMLLPWLWPERMDAAFLLRRFDLVVPDVALIGPGSKAMLTLTAAIYALSPLLPLWMLYRLGRCLGRENALNAQTANSVRQLAHSLLASTLLIPLLGGIAAGLVVFASAYSASGIEFQSSPPQSFIKFIADLGTGILILFVACTCLYSLAWLIQLGADASDDSRSIV